MLYLFIYFWGFNLNWMYVLQRGYLYCEWVVGKKRRFVLYYELTSGTLVVNQDRNIGLWIVYIYIYVCVCVCVCVCLLILDYRWEWYGNFTFVFGQNPDYNKPFNIEWKLSISFLNYSFSHKLVLLSIADYKIAIKSSKTVSYSCEFSKLTGMLKFKDLKFT